MTLLRNVECLARAATTRAYVDTLSHDGRGIAHPKGKTVFIEGALPGEDVEFQLTRSRRDYDEGRVSHIYEASTDRVSPRCLHFGVCGGCALQHCSPDAQVVAKQQTLLDNLKRIGKVQPKELFHPLTDSVWGYRRRARLSVRYELSRRRAYVGFMEKHGRRITETSRCETLHPKIGLLLKPLALLVSQLGIAARIPQIEVAIGDDVTVLLLRILSPPDAMDKEKLSDFERAHDLRFYVQPGKGDSTGPLTAGRVDLFYRLPDWNIAFEPSDFIQINAGINRQLVKRALELLQIDSQKRVLDLFCGLGNFTLPMARIAKGVVGIEAEPGLVIRAQANARRNGLTNVGFYQADLFAVQKQAVWLQQPYDRLLLDPPRSGAHQILTCLKGKLPPRLVYISCHPATLARDAKLLVHGYGYELLSAGVVDMFPHTAHIESMAVFARAGRR
jgi:23S rRNA (uracil1939-C5)-methyltransferase